MADDKKSDKKGGKSSGKPAAKTPGAGYQQPPDKAAEKAAAKAAKKSPLTEGQRQVAAVGAYVSFGLCGLAVLGGLLLIVFG